MNYMNITNTKNMRFLPKSFFHYKFEIHKNCAKGSKRHQEVYLPIYSISMKTTHYIVIIFALTYLLAHLPIPSYITYKLVHLPIPTYLHNLPTSSFAHTFLPTYLPTYQPTYLHNLPTSSFAHTYLPLPSSFVGLFKLILWSLSKSFEDGVHQLGDKTDSELFIGQEKEIGRK